MEQLYLHPEWLMGGTSTYDNDSFFCCGLEVWQGQHTQWMALCIISEFSSSDLQVQTLDGCAHMVKFSLEATLQPISIGTI
jgi:hypothetical protein